MEHSNANVGRVVDWRKEEHPEAKIPCIWVQVEHFNDNSVDNESWNKILQGAKGDSSGAKGFSFGGHVTGFKHTCKEKIGCGNAAEGLEPFEVSLVN